MTYALYVLLFFGGFVLGIATEREMWAWHQRRGSR